MVELFNEVLGTEVEIPERPRRIVSFSPAATESLFEVGAGERVVGVSAFCARPSGAREKRKVGSYNTVRPEMLDELRPDLIIAVTGYQRKFAVELSMRYPVYPLELPVSVAGIVDFVIKVGLVAGEAEEARKLAAELLRGLGRVRGNRGLSTYVELDLGGPVAFGAYSYITDAVRLVGGRSITGGQRGEWLKPDLKFVADEDPDLVVYEPKMFTKFGAADLEKLIRDRSWDGLKATRSRNCFVTPGPLDFLAHHGPSFVRQAVPWLEGTMDAAAKNLGEMR